MKFTRPPKPAYPFAGAGLQPAPPRSALSYTQVFFKVEKNPIPQ
jgi:hypothetical protein